MASRYEREDSDVNIAVISNDDHPMTNNFELEEPPLLSSAPGPWWHKMSANPADWYKGAVKGAIKEAKDFSWEITEPNHVLLRAIFGEGLCTFLFLFIVEATVVNNGRQSQPENLVLGCISTAFCSIALIYSFADVSGAHFNPAVTFATVVTGKTTVRKGLAYLGIQLIASIFATLALMIVFPRPTAADTKATIPEYVIVDIDSSAKYTHAFFMEVMLTFILVYVIFATAFDTVDTKNNIKVEADGSRTAEKKTTGQNLTIYTTSGNTKAGFAPVAIGFTLGFLSLLGGTVSGGVYNPARAFGPAIISGRWARQELYWFADFLGAALAGFAQSLFAHEAQQTSSNIKAKTVLKSGNLKTMSDSDSSDEWVEAPQSKTAQSTLKRDDWMTSSYDTIGKVKKRRNPDELADDELTPKELAERKKKAARIDRELNPDFKQVLATNNGNEAIEQSTANVAPQIRKYEFGDKGSSWRMMKLKRVFEMAERESLPVEDVALERYASLEEFEDALAEKDFLAGKRPQGQSEHRKRSSKYMNPSEQKASASVQKEIVKSSVPAAIVSNQINTISDDILSVDQLNKLYSKLLKAKLMGSSEVGELEARYEIEKHKSENNRVVVLPNIDSRGMLKTSAKNDKQDGKSLQDSVSDMVKEETLGTNDGYDSIVAGRIMTDGGFKADLEYLDERADQLAHKKQNNVSSRGQKFAINDFRRSQEARKNCPFCSEDQTGPRAQIIAQGTRVFLSFPETIDMVQGHCLIVPNEHVLTLLDCDDDEWTEIRNFQKSVIRMFDTLNKGVVFIEQVISFHSHRHAVMDCIPIPADFHADSPAYFKEAIMESEGEWSQHKKLIDTSDKGIRRSMVKNLPYFHVWFDPNRGYGHVIEDSKEWKEWFGREVIASMLDLEPEKWRKPRRPTTREQSERKEWFQNKWHPYDWTRLLSS